MEVVVCVVVTVVLAVDPRRIVVLAQVVRGPNRDVADQDGQNGKGSDRLHRDSPLERYLAPYLRTSGREHLRGAEWAGLRRKPTARYGRRGAPSPSTAQWQTETRTETQTTSTILR